MLPSKEKANALVDLWYARYAEWITEHSDAYLQGLLDNPAGCPFCIAMRQDNPEEEPFANCKTECPFYVTCFQVYVAMKRKVEGRFDVKETEKKFLELLAEMTKEFEGAY